MKKITLITLLLTVSFFASAQEFNFASNAEGFTSALSSGSVVHNSDDGTVTYSCANSKYDRFMNSSLDISPVNTYFHIRLKNLSSALVTLHVWVEGGVRGTVDITTTDSDFKDYYIPALTEWDAGDKGVRIYFRNGDGFSSWKESVNIDLVEFIDPSTLAVEDINFKDDASIAIYPNPVNNVLNINGKNKIESIEVINVLGQTTMVQEGASKTLNTSSLPKGVYILKIYQENDVISTKRFIKE